MAHTIDHQVLERFLDENGIVDTFPSKLSKKQYIIYYLASKFDKGDVLDEIDVNNIIREWISFGDYVAVRRFLVDYKFLIRDKDGKEYTVADYEIN